MRSRLAKLLPGCAAGIGRAGAGVGAAGTGAPGCARTATWATGIGSLGGIVASSEKALSDMPG